MYASALQPNCIILAITPANQDVATSDAVKIAREFDPTGKLSENFSCFLVRLYDLIWSMCNE